MRIDRRWGRKWSGLSLGAILVLAGAGVTASRGDGPTSNSKQVEPVPISVRDPAESQDKLARKKEHCSVDPELLRSIGRAKGEQVRIRRGDDFAIFTVTETPDEQPDAIVRVGRLGRLRLGSTQPFDARVEPTVIVPDLTVEQARERGEMVERLADDGKNTRLLILAPHGGQIEPSTDLEAERLADALSRDRTSTWICRGYHGTGNQSAFDRWHITSTEISEASYPKLAKVADRTFAHAVSFHGMVDDRILIGGNAPTRLRTEIRDAIRAEVKDPKVIVDLAMPTDSNNGLGKTNIVNRYCPTGGVQIEQSARVRKEHWKEVADAVARVFASKL
jgi:phage replication-related protein YjqB (UPF0714/DUF867 family)